MTSDSVKKQDNNQSTRNHAHYCDYDLEIIEDMCKDKKVGVGDSHTISDLKILDKIQKVYNQLAVAIQMHHVDLNSGKPEIADFLSAMADDLNTSNALAALFEKVKLANVELRKNPVNIQEISGIFASISAILSILGIKLETPILTPELEKIYNEYLRLKSEKKFEESDKLRNVLMENKII